MSNDKLIGGIMLVGSLGCIAAYFYLMFMAPSDWTLLTIQISAFMAVAAVLLIVAWIGYTLATTPPPMPLEDLDFDLNDDGDITEDTDEKNH